MIKCKWSELETAVNSLAEDKYEVLGVTGLSGELHYLQIAYERRGGVGCHKHGVYFFNRLIHDPASNTARYNKAVGMILCRTKDEIIKVIRDFDYDMYDIARAIFDDTEIAFKIARGNNGQS